MIRFFSKKIDEDIRVDIWTPGDKIICIIAYDKHSKRNVVIFSGSSTNNAKSPRYFSMA